MKTHRIFISYARGDGPPDQPFVRLLHADLIAAGFTVWFNRESLLTRGLTFHQEIKDVIRTEVDRVVYVGGPKTAQSAYVREEWQSGLKYDHFVVTPLLRLGEYETCVSGELSLLHYNDFCDDANYPAALTKLISSHIPVSLFTETEALQLHAESVGTDRAILPTEANDIVRECGCLPLALALCGGVAKKRQGDFRHVLERLRRADLDNIANRESLNEQHRSIWQAMQASLDMLSDDEQHRFAELVAFGTDGTVPEAAAETLWAHTGNLNDLDTEDQLINLGERSLIQLDQKPNTDGKTSRRFRLHDPLHNYAVRITGAPPADRYADSPLAVRRTRRPWPPIRANHLPLSLLWAGPRSLALRTYDVGMHYQGGHRRRTILDLQASVAEFAWAFDKQMVHFLSAAGQGRTF